MVYRFLRAGLVAWLFLLFVGTASGNGPCRLVIQISCPQESNGVVRVAVWKGDAGFLKGEPYRNSSAELKNGKAEVALSDLEAEEYAVSAYLDKNSNGKLDRNFVGKPTEPYGFSNGARGKFGPPKYQEAAFHLGAEGKTVAVELK